MRGCWKVRKVEVWSKIQGRPAKSQANAHYRFHVTGMNHAGGSLAPREPEEFSWTVPGINDEGFDLHDAEFTAEAAALAAEIYGFAWLQAHSARAGRDFDAASLEDTHPLTQEEIKAALEKHR